MTLRPYAPWHALAQRAADRIAGGQAAPDAVRGVLAQWTCEQAGPWPPARDNPGNLARGFAAAAGVPYTVAPGPNPQPGNPIVTYATPEAGADAYANGLASFSRYAAARAAIRAGDGRAFLVAVTQAGYGTGLPCCLRAYAALPAPTAGHTLHIADGATVTSYTRTAAGCLDGMTRERWHGGDSKATCGPLERVAGCSSGRADVVPVTEGAFRGRWVAIDPPGTSVT